MSQRQLGDIWAGQARLDDDGIRATCAGAHHCQGHLESLLTNDGAYSYFRLAASESITATQRLAACCLHIMSIAPLTEYRKPRQQAGAVDYFNMFNHSHAR